jgi:hypothetical protein
MSSFDFVNDINHKNLKIDMIFVILRNYTKLYDNNLQVMNKRELEADE